jgi:hypothetical protein
MGYRDDVDTLYQRSLILQKELDAAQQRLADRDAELEKLRGGNQFEIPDTSPGLRTLRDLPPAETLLSRLVDTISSLPRFVTDPVQPQQDPMELIQPELRHRAAVLEAAREHLDHLPDKLLMIVGTIIEDLALEKPQRELIERLRVISEEIAINYQRRRSGLY